MKNPYKQKSKGFSIIELLVVIVVIGILAVITFIFYIGVQARAVDASVQSDINNMNSSQLQYGLDTNGSALAYYSGSGRSATLNFTPNGGNVIDVVTNGKDYCIRGYNTSGTKNSIFNAFTKESTASVCSQLNSSMAAIAASPHPSAAPLSPVADWFATPQGDHYGNFYDLVGHNWASVSRSTAKTIYDPNTQKIYDVPANQLAINPRSDGKSGSEAVIEETRTNYLINSRGSVNNGVDLWTGGWAYGSSFTGTPARSLDSGVYGTTAQHVQYSALTGDTGFKYCTLSYSTPDGSFASGDSATLSVWMKGAVSQSGGAPLQIHIQALNAAFQATGIVSLTINPTSTWTRYTLTYPSLPAGTVKIQAYGFWFANSVLGDTYDVTVDAMQLEKGAFATSYIPTTTATVTRNADVVTVPTTGWSATAGSFVAVAGTTPNPVASIATTWGSSGTDKIEIYVGGGSDVTAMVLAAGNNKNDTQSGTNAPHVWAGTWASGGNIAAYADGTNAAPVGGVSTPTGMLTTAIIGSNGGVYFWDGPIQRATIYSSALSPSDINTVTNAVKNGP